MCIRGKYVCAVADCNSTQWLPTIANEDWCRYAQENGKPCSPLSCFARETPWMCPTCRTAQALSQPHPQMQSVEAWPIPPQPRSRQTGALYTQNPKNNVWDEFRYVAAAVDFGCDREEATAYYCYHKYGQIPDLAGAGPSVYGGIPNLTITEASPLPPPPPQLAQSIFDVHQQAARQMPPPPAAAAPLLQRSSNTFWGLAPPRSRTTGKDFTGTVLSNNYDEYSYVRAAVNFGCDEDEARDYWRRVRAMIARHKGS